MDKKHENQIRELIKLLPIDNRKLYRDLLSDTIKRKKAIDNYHKVYTELEKSEQELYHKLEKEAIKIGLCKGCGSCCTRGIGIEGKAKYNIVMKYLEENQDKLEFPLEVYKRGVYSENLYINKHKATYRIATLGKGCLMLTKDHLCTIHPVKPETCKKYTPGLFCMLKNLSRVKKILKS